MEELALQVQIGSIPGLDDFVDECRLHLGGELVLWYAPGYGGYAREVQVMSEILPVWHAVQSSVGALFDPKELAPLSAPVSPAAHRQLEMAFQELLPHQPATWGDYAPDGDYEQRLMLLRQATLALRAPGDRLLRLAFATACESVARDCFATACLCIPDWLMPFLWLWAYWTVLGELSLPDEAEAADGNP